MAVYRYKCFYVALSAWILVVNCARLKDSLEEYDGSPLPPTPLSPTSVLQADSRPPPPPPRAPGNRAPGNKAPPTPQVPGLDGLSKALGIAPGFGFNQLTKTLAAVVGEFTRSTDDLLKRLSDDFAKANDDLLKRLRAEFEASGGSLPESTSRKLNDDFAKANDDLLKGLRAEFDKSSDDLLTSMSRKAWEAIEKAGSKYRVAPAEGEGGKKDRLQKGLAVMMQSEERNPVLLAAVKEGLSGFDEKTGNLHVEEHMMEVRGSQPLPLSELLDRAGFKPNETLVAFDFDLTVKAPVRDCSCSPAAVGWAPRRGVLHALEEVKARGVETIVVTAETPSKSTWSNIDGIYETAQKLNVLDYFGKQFGPGPPVGIRGMQSESGKHKREHVWVGDYVTDKNKGGIFQAGHGLVLAAYEKGPAIEHYIYYFQRRDRIKHIIFVDDAVHNAYNVAVHFKMEENDAAFEKDSADRPSKSALSRIDSIWWSTQDLLLDKACDESGEGTSSGEGFCTYEGSDGTDNSYRDDPLYNMYRERVRAGSMKSS
mmetsp:Transcript_8450/g.23762  ORF Transcript_8450/g.23762 Transcript_8450/m.23762 type:complete len:539 (+) Transcript_8450:75-1691(+)